LKTLNLFIKHLQINLPNGGFTVADNVWVKIIEDDFGGFKYDVIINEVKLSSKIPFTKRQNEFIEAIGKTDSKFTLRNTKFFKDGFEQGIPLNVKAYIKTNTQGKPNVLDNLDITKIK